jgi:hypothetical protein
MLMVAQRVGVLAIGVALAVPIPVPHLKPDLAGPVAPVRPPVIVTAPAEAVPTASEARELGGARDDQRRQELECLLFAVHADQCGRSD